MQGFDEFIKLFGDITVLQIAETIMACVFMFFIYKQVRKYFRKKTEEEIRRAETEKKRDEKIEEALEAVRKYPEYRRQSVEIQKDLNNKISSLTDLLNQTRMRLEDIEETTKRRERNKIRDRLLQNHRYYTSKDTNPTQSWTEMEADAFWELFKEYEEQGGDGYMHTDVMPNMKLLTVIQQSKT